MERIVLQTLGKVHDLQTSRLVKLRKVDQTLVRDPTVLVGKLERVVFRESFCDVVGGEERKLGGIRQTLAAEHLDVRPRDGRDTGRSPRRGGNSLNGLVTSGLDDRVAGKEWLQMGSHTDRSDSRSTAAVRDTEGLVQIEMAHVGADSSRVGQTDLGVEVGAVEVDLTAVAMDDFACLADAFFKDTECRGVGDHECSQAVLVLFRLCRKVGEVEGAVGKGFDYED
jgi:hypothetical protein